MAGRQDTIWKCFLSPVARLLIDEDGLRRYADSIDWEKECDRFRRDDVIILLYYSNQNFHGIAGGHLNYGAAVTSQHCTLQNILQKVT